MSAATNVPTPAGDHISLQDGTSKKPVLNKQTGQKEEPLNVRLDARKIHYEVRPVVLKPRRYQEELCLKALKNNVIIYLGTGLGKTFITVLFLNNSSIDKSIQSGQKVAFLAPTQDLIKQQAEYINKHVDYKVRVYCGRSAKCGLHIDHWDKKAWDDELRQVDILFLTPQIFLAAVSTGLLRWTQFCAVIFDEFHHASRPSKGKVSNHPFMQVLNHYKGFYSIRPNLSEWPRPRMIGLTASLINKMPKNRDDIRIEVDHIEKVISGHCITDFGIIDSRPNSIIHSFTSFNLDHVNDIFCEMFTKFVESLNQALKVNKEQRIYSKKPKDLTFEDKKTFAFLTRLKLAATGFSIKPGSFPKVMAGLNVIRQREGLWMLRAVTFKLVKALERHSINACLPQEMKEIYKDFTLMLQTLYTHLDAYLNDKQDQGLLSCTRPKPKALLERLKIEYDRTMDGTNGKSDFSCIVFVTSRLEVVALNTWLQTVSNTLNEYKFIRNDYAIGLAATVASKYSCITKRKAIEQYNMLRDFREKRLNVIITTSVLEEGIDLPICSTVIRYDTAHNFRQYVQSRGRARQEISTFVTLSEQVKFSEMVSMLDKFYDFEKTLKKALGDKDIAPSTRESRPYVPPPPEEAEDIYTSDDMVVIIHPVTAKTILSMYCNQISQRTPFTEGVRYERNMNGNLYQTILYLPSGCPLSKKGIAGNMKLEESMADDSAIIAAVKALIAAGELDKNGVPTRINKENVDTLLNTMSLEPKFEPLPKILEGIHLVEGEKQAYLFEPKIRKESDYLRKNFMNRTYKLLRFKFEANRHDTRLETKPFFEKSVFGLIVDANANNDWIPPFLNSHYGQYKVQYREIRTNLVIKSSSDHSRYLAYTHTILYRYLFITGLRKEQLTNHCQFYIVPLNELDEPDSYKMRQEPPTMTFRPGNVVKMNSYYTLSNDRFSKRDDRLYLVRSIRTDMNAKSYIPGRRNQTFLDHAVDNYGPQSVASNRINDPIIEVMPISKEYGQINELKQSKRDHETGSLFYMCQFLDLFASDAAYVFQAYMLPEMIYRLYITLMAQELDKQFQNDTNSRRQVSLLQISESDLNELKIGGSVQNDECVMEEEPEEPVQIQDEQNTSKDANSLGSESESDEATDDESIESDDTEFSDNEETVGPDYNEMLTKRTLLLNNDDDGRENLKKWDLTKYQANDIVKQNHEHYLSCSQQEPYLDTMRFVPLQNVFSHLQHKLINQIEAFEGRITSNENFLDETAEFQKRTNKVDRSISPPIFFDRNTKPLKEGSREKGLVEALTLRRASQLYSLEGLENVGDSFLKYLVSVVLYMRLSGNEGFLTAARSRLVSNEHFTYLAKKNGLGAYAITNSFKIDYLAYMLGKTNDRPGANRDNEQQYWNKLRPKSLADIVESIVGSYLIYHSEFEAVLAAEWLGLKIFDESIFDELHEKAVVFSKAPTALIDGDQEEIQEYYKNIKSKVRRLEDILGYKFNDPSYLVQAITHASAFQKCTRSYERLEFLGDAILDYLVTMTLMKEANLQDPGQMTSSKSALVNNCAFAKLAMSFKFDLFIQHCNSSIYDELIKVRNAIDEDPEMVFLDMIDFDKVVKLLGDVFESVAGAIYLDSGNSLDSVWSVYYPMMKEAIDAEIKNPSKNYTALLHEMYPGPGRIEFESFDYKTEEGDLVKFTCNVVGVGEYSGKGISRKEAKKRAIREAVTNAPSLEERKKINEAWLAKHSQNVPSRWKSSRGGRQGGHRGGGRGNGRGKRPSYKRF